MNNLTARTIARQQAGQIGRNRELEAESFRCGDCRRVRARDGEGVCPTHYYLFRDWRQSECARLDAEGVPVPEITP